MKSDKQVINMVYLKYTSKYVCFMLHVCDNLADIHTSCFLFKSSRAEISPFNQPLKIKCLKMFIDEESLI